MNVVLNGHCSRFFCRNVPQGFILRPTLFVIFLNDLPNFVSSQLDIYAEHTNIYSCFNKKSDQLDKVKLAADIKKNYLQSVVNWCKKWHINFKCFKMKLLSLYPLKEHFCLPSTRLTLAFRRVTHCSFSE